MRYVGLIGQTLKGNMNQYKYLIFAEDLYVTSY
jgi:hypothetical protein